MVEAAKMANKMAANCTKYRVIGNVALMLQVADCLEKVTEVCSESRTKDKLN